MNRTKLTANKGASEIRRLVLRKMNELERGLRKKGYLQSCRGVQEAWDKLREYIKGMAKRASKKPGGLGRK